MHVKEVGIVVLLDWGWANVPALDEKAMRGAREDEIAALMTVD